MTDGDSEVIDQLEDKEAGKGTAEIGDTMQKLVSGDKQQVCLAVEEKSLNVRSEQSHVGPPN